MNGFYAILGLTDKAGDVMRTVDKLEKITPVDLSDLVPPEGEGQVVVVQGHVLGQGHGEVEAEAQVAVALGEAVDLLLRLPAALGEEHLAGLDDGRIQRGEAIKAVGLPQRCEEGLHQDLLARQQLHEA